MTTKKRVLFLIIPAIILYLGVMLSIMAASVTKKPNPSFFGMSKKQKAEHLASAIDETIVEPNTTLERITEEELQNVTVANTNSNQEKSQGIGFFSAIKNTFLTATNNLHTNAVDTNALDVHQPDTSVASTNQVDANGKDNPTKEELALADASADANNASTDALAGIGGADVNPKGIETPELYYTVYRIKEGDMIGVLAENYGVTQDTLISVNNIKSSRTIQIGQYICIPSIPGIVYTTKDDGETPDTIAEKYKVSAAKVALVNQAEPSVAFNAGTTLFVPDAELDWVTRQEINGDLFAYPLRRGYYFSSRYGYRSNPFTGKRTFHNGLDMAAPKGTAIYAALEGTVTAAGWDNVYGNYVIVRHHTGYKTLYGHMSRITTKRGAYVTTSTKLGEVGSTGQSTGPHLHFTVYKNDRTINPLQLLPSR